MSETHVVSALKEKRVLIASHVPGCWWIGMEKKAPFTIEGTYRVVDHSPRREPVFNNWRNAVPLVVLILVPVAWLLGTHQH